MKNLVLGTAAVLAMMACSKKTPEADTTTTTSGMQETVPQATTPAAADDNNAGAPATAAPVRSNNGFKDGGHVDSLGAGAYDQGGPNGIGQPIDRDQDRLRANPDAMKDQRMAPVDKANGTPKSETNKVHGNGTTPGTTGQLNSNQQR